MPRMTAVYCKVHQGMLHIRRGIALYMYEERVQKRRMPATSGRSKPNNMKP